MANFTVIYDACVLYPAPLRDLLIRLAVTRRFRARWTEEIQEEWIRSLLKNEPERKREDLERTAELANKAVPDCLISGYEDIIDELELSDQDDRHVLAAAIRAGAAAIVTMNLSDFPPSVLSRYDIFAIHPDDFILDLADLEPQVLERVAKEQRKALHSPQYSAEQFVSTMRRQGLPGVASFLEERIDLI